MTKKLDLKVIQYIKNGIGTFLMIGIRMFLRGQIRIRNTALLYKVAKMEQSSLAVLRAGKYFFLTKLFSYEMCITSI